jgi:hypothetical protein
MIKKYFHFKIWLFVLLPALSCEKQTTWDIQTSGTFPVVDCIITNELKYQELRLYQSADTMNTMPAGISGASIVLSDGTNTMEFGEDAFEAGRYVSEAPFRAAAGNRYRLTVTYGGISDTAYASMTAVTPLEQFEIVPYDSLSRFIFHSGSQPSMTEVCYDWSDAEVYCEKYGSCKASEVFYTLDNIDISKQFAPDKQIIPFPENTRIIRRKYSLSDDHQRFIRSLLLETDWRGGLFDTEQGNVPTNFSHGVRGWFAACMVVSDTTFFK